MRAIRTRDFHFPSRGLAHLSGRLRIYEAVDDEVLVGSNIRDGVRRHLHSVVCGGCSRNGAGIRWHVSWKRSWTGSLPGTQHDKPDSKSAPGTRAATGYQWAAQSLRTPVDGKRIAIVSAGEQYRRLQYNEPHLDSETRPPLLSLVRPVCGVEKFSEETLGSLPHFPSSADLSTLG